MTETTTRPSRRSIVGATVAAAVVAAVVLVVAVLPAEYGIDPLGTGAALGLTALAGTGEDAPAGATTPEVLAPVRPGVNTPASRPYKEDRFEIELRPFEGVEYKYRMEKGTSLVYSWTATARVEYEFHGEPDGAPAKYFESYEKAESAGAHGAFVAPASGIHGWYWKNPGATRVTVTLVTAGFYDSAIELRGGKRIVHPLTGQIGGQP